MSEDIAVLMAAGMGTRMRPLTEKVPKPLVKVHGVSMIETVINGLKNRGIERIILVTGYLGEQFQYLQGKYEGITIVANTEYETINNISSIYAAMPYINGKNCFICEADLYVKDISVFQMEMTQSGYFGKMVLGHSDDWVFEQNKEGYITRVGKSGDNCYNMCGISYFIKEDMKVITDAIEEAYKQPGYEDLFWDDIVNQEIKKVNLKIYPVRDDQIVEIDSVAELKAVDPDYIRWNN